MAKNTNRLLVWVIVVLSILVCASMFPPYKIGLGGADLRAAAMFLYLIPIGLAAFYLGTAASVIAALTSAVMSAGIIAWGRYMITPYEQWLANGGGAGGYARFLTAPLFDSGIIWELILFLLLAYCLGFLFGQLRSLKGRTEQASAELHRQSIEITEERKRVGGLRAKYAEDVTRLNSFIVIFSDLAKEISSVLELGSLYKLITQKTSKLLSARQCAIYEVDKANNRLTLVCSEGYEEKELFGLRLSADEDSGLPGWCASHGKFLSKEEIKQDPYMADLLREEKIPVELCQPIVERGQVIAVICVGGIERALNQQELVRLMTILGSLSAIAIENARLMEKTHQQAIRDGLTGLYNHRHFHELLEQRLSEAGKNKGLLGVIFIDVDHFKKFNDTYGHQAGDLVLHNTARLLESRLEEKDVAARYGGEEFVLIVSRENPAQVKELAESIRKTVESSVLKSGQVSLKVTISLGGSVYQPQKGKAVKRDELIKQADEALYKSKEGGRNRVTFHCGL